MGEACKVLIVDDEMLIRQGIINYINWEQEGFHIIGEASNGKEAMQIIADFSPHIVITDIVMPIMDGIDLVREAKKAFPNIEIIVLSSFEDFDYVRSTFQNGVADYILKPKLNGPELLRILNQVVSRIPNLQHSASVKPTRSTEEMLGSMILGYDFSMDQAVLSAVFTNSQFALVGVRGKNIDPTQLKTMLKRSFLEEMPVFLLSSTETETTFLLNFNAHQLEAIKQTIERRAAEKPDTTWILYEPFNIIDDIKKVYDEGRVKMKKYLFYLPEKTLFVYDHLPKENEKQANFDLNHFIEMFKDRLFNSTFTYLENHVDYLAGRYNNDSFEFKSFLGNIVFNVIVLLDTMKYDIADIEQKKYGYFSTINDARHVNEALEQFNGFLQEVRTIMLSGDKANDQFNNIERILAYIEQHYTEPLRLSEIANHFHFNASYLSSYFSTHHKEGFSEYLNRVRIKKSMELLENSRVSISNISGMVGYSEHSYFCKVFKRITGMSPGSYRKELQAHHENEEEGLSSLKK
ncbi:two-component response regulator [Planococcus antarcticus DSM 14505]|uniref:Two-component response regulator n=1 Tax=Planococcus antarcticus DSM 14505 TaxID=1185653 RepID=A0AA87LSK3_9BACL|nr:response regulator transcription factor [Planococcus antarcticus]EIM07978.1 two-component response regulator [Planococcus antarcticus DSM 14505]